MQILNLFLFQLANLCYSNLELITSVISNPEPLNSYTDKKCLKSLILLCHPPHHHPSSIGKFHIQFYLNCREFCTTTSLQLHNFSFSSAVHFTVRQWAVIKLLFLSKQPHESALLEGKCSSGEEEEDWFIWCEIIFNLIFKMLQCLMGVLLKFTPFFSHLMVTYVFKMFSQVLFFCFSQNNWC